MKFGTGSNTERTRSEHKNTRGSKYKMTYVRPHIYINKQISTIFNCVTPESVSLANYTKYQLYAISLYTLWCTTVI